MDLRESARRPEFDCHFGKSEISEQLSVAMDRLSDYEKKFNKECSELKDALNTNRKEFNDECNELKEQMDCLSRSEMEADQMKDDIKVYLEQMIVDDLIKGFLDRMFYNTQAGTTGEVKSMDSLALETKVVLYIEHELKLRMRHLVDGILADYAKKKSVKEQIFAVQGEMMENVGRILTTAIPMLVENAIQNKDDTDRDKGSDSGPGDNNKSKSKVRKR